MGEIAPTPHNEVPPLPLYPVQLSLSLKQSPVEEKNREEEENCEDDDE